MNEDRPPHGKALDRGRHRRRRKGLFQFGGRRLEPEEHDAAFGAPAWAGDSTSFLFPTSSGRDTVAIARYELAGGDWRYVIEDDWDLDCVGDRGGRVLAVHGNVDARSRLEVYDPQTLERRLAVELPGEGMLDALVVSPEGERLAQSRLAAKMAVPGVSTPRRRDQPPQTRSWCSGHCGSSRSVMRKPAPASSATQSPSVRWCST